MISVESVQRRLRPPFSIFTSLKLRNHSVLKLLGLFCLSLAWLVPNHSPPWVSFYNESSAALGLILLVLAQGRQGWLRPLPLAAWVVSGVACIPWLQWLAGQLAFSGDAVVSCLYLLGLAGGIAAGHAWAAADRRHAAEALSVAAMVAALISSCMALAQALMISGLDVWMLDPVIGMRPYGNLAQPNNLATLLGFGIVGLLLLYETERIGPAVGAMCISVLVLGLSLTQSRTALLFCPAMLLGLWLVRRRGLTMRFSLWAGLLVAVAHWVLTWAVPSLLDILLLSGPVSLGSRGLESLRGAHWIFLFRALAESPYVGFGWLQVGTAELNIAGRYPPLPEFWMFAHNLFLDLLIWCGYPLGLVLSALIGYWYVSRAMRVRTIEAVAAMLVVTVFGIHAMLELPHHYAYFLIPVGLWIGQAENAVGSTCRIRPRWALVPALIGAAMLVGICKDYAEVEEDFRLLRFETLRIGSLRAAQPAPDAPFLSSITAYVRAGRIEPTTGMSAVELAQASAVAERYPYPITLYRLARAQALNGQIQQARSTLLKLKSMHGADRMPRIKQDLRDRVASGQTGLRALAEGFPD